MEFQIWIFIDVLAAWMPCNLIQWCFMIWVKEEWRGKATRDGKRMHVLSDLMKGKYLALQRRQERVAEIVKSWKSCTCFSADYLKKYDILQGKVATCSRCGGISDDDFVSLRIYCRVSEWKHVTDQRSYGAVVGSSRMSHCWLRRAICLVFLHCCSVSSQLRSEAGFWLLSVQAM